MEYLRCYDERLYRRQVTFCSLIQMLAAALTEIPVQRTGSKTNVATELHILGQRS